MSAVPAAVGSADVGSAAVFSVGASAAALGAFISSAGVTVCG